MKVSFNRKIQKMCTKSSDCLLAVTSVEHFNFTGILIGSSFIYRLSVPCPTYNCYLMIRNFRSETFEN